MVDAPWAGRERCGMSRIDELFAELQARQARRKLPPVTRWQPDRVGRIDIRIARDGTWYHDGSPIRRQPLVDLFATVLRRDPDGFCLVTPAEKLLIEVDDAPFIAIDMDMRGSGTAAELLFTTNVGDHVVAGPEHPLRVAGADRPRPYVMVRHGLEALLSRAVYYRLVDAAVEESGVLAAYSRDERFVLGAV